MYSYKTIDESQFAKERLVATLQSLEQDHKLRSLNIERITDILENTLPKDDTKQMSHLTKFLEDETANRSRDEAALISLRKQITDEEIDEIITSGVLNKETI
jgi:hypothetical protein